MLAYSNLIKAQVKWSQRFIDYLETSCQAYSTLQDRNVSASKAWIMYQSANYKWKHKKRLCIHHLQDHSPANPMLTMLCCTSDNQQWTLHLAHLSAGYATLLKRQEHPMTQMVKLLVQFYSVLRITWHQPSLRVWIFPWNLRTSHKAFTPSDPIGL